MLGSSGYAWPYAPSRASVQAPRRRRGRDGDELTRLMIQYDVGCRIEETLFIKKVDEEFFEE
jgi:restriction endonuclease Mrr